MRTKPRGANEPTQISVPSANCNIEKLEKKEASLRLFHDDPRGGKPGALSNPRGGPSARVARHPGLVAANFIRKNG